jgi:hypothetical protein
MLNKCEILPGFVLYAVIIFERKSFKIPGIFCNYFYPDCLIQSIHATKMQLIFIKVLLFGEVFPVDLF